MSHPSPEPQAAVSTAAAAPAFPNFTELPSWLPGWAWRLLRMGSVATALALAAFLLRDPDHALPLFWGLIVPALPLVFMFTPGLWRNLCPLATSNQLPRRLGISQGLTQRVLSQGLAYPVGMGLLIAGVMGRKLLFNLSGTASAGLILAAMAAALLGGLLFKGKSGWCSSICPLLPVQRLYGQTPFIRIANTQCEPCVGCAKNCYDFNPGQAYLADQYDPNPNYRDFRRFFAGIFPGLILGYYLVPDVARIGAAEVVLQMTLYLAGSLGVFTLLDLLLGVPRNVLPVVSAALAINLYYWFAAPLAAQMLQRLGVYPDLTLVGALRTAVAIGSLVWVHRSLRLERQFLSEQVQRSGSGEIALAPVVVETVRLNRRVIPITAAPAGTTQALRSDGSSSAPVPLDPAATAIACTAPSTKSNDDAAAGPANATITPGASTDPASITVSSAANLTSPGATPITGLGGPPELRIEPEGRRVALRTGRSLLDLLEGCGADIHPGCRAGVCGADAIAVTGGADCLGPVGDTERATLARLGHASNTRLACMARVRQKGCVRVALKPQAADAVVPAIDASVTSAPGGTPVAVAGTDATTTAVGTGSTRSTPSSQPLEAATGSAMTPIARTAGTAPGLVQSGARESANDAGDRLAAVRRVVIIGNGIAGLSAAEELRRRHPACEIDLVTREDRLSYNRMALASLIHGSAGLVGHFLKPEGWYAEQRVRPWINTRAAALDLRRQRVTLATGQALRWDRLILATGAQAWLPPVEGWGRPGCFVLRSAPDAIGLRAYVQAHGARRAVVVGAGLLGLEAAEALHRLGLETQLLSLGPRVLDRQIDARASALVVQHLRRCGIEHVPQALLARVEAGPHGRVQRLHLADGRCLQADLVLVCAGTRANLRLAKAAGLACGRGITVDLRMCTSARHVYAAGDVAEVEGAQPGLWGVAAAQGRIAALSALGLPGLYRPVQPVTALKLAGIQLRAAGQPEPRDPLERVYAVDAPDDDVDEDDAANGAVSERHSPPLHHARLVVKDRRVIGAVVLGEDPQADDLLAAASRQQVLGSLDPSLRARLQPVDAVAPRPVQASAHATAPQAAAQGTAPQAPATALRRVA